MNHGLPHHVHMRRGEDWQCPTYVNREDNTGDVSSADGGPTAQSPLRTRVLKLPPRPRRVPREHVRGPSGEPAIETSSHPCAPCGFEKQRVFEREPKVTRGVASRWSRRGACRALGRPRTHRLCQDIGDSSFRVSNRVTFWVTPFRARTRARNI